MADDRPARALPNNLKFEVFFDDMQSLKLEPAQVKKNVSQYVTKLESYFNKAIKEQKTRIERLKKAQRTKIGQATRRADERSELEDILIDAIDKTKTLVIKRKLVAEKLLNKKDRKLSIQVNEMSQGVLSSEGGSIMETSDGKGMEEALQKL